NEAEPRAGLSRICPGAEKCRATKSRIVNNEDRFPISMREKRSFRFISKPKEQPPLSRDFFDPKRVGNLFTTVSELFFLPLESKCEAVAILSKDDLAGHVAEDRGFGQWVELRFRFDKGCLVQFPS